MRIDDISQDSRILDGTSLVQVTGVLKIVSREALVEEILMELYGRIFLLELANKLIDVVEHDGVDRFLIGLVDGWHHEDESLVISRGDLCQVVVDLPRFVVGLLVDGQCGVDDSRDGQQFPFSRTVLDVEFHIS